MDVFLTIPENKRKMLIRWADIIVLNSGQDGILDQGSFNLDWETSSRPFTYQETIFIKNDPARKFRAIATRQLKITDGIDKIMAVLTEARNDIATHLYREGYIEDKFDWTLTERGKLMKEVGGHNAFKKFRRREINQIKNQSNINRLLILATLSTALVPWIIAKWYPSKPIIVSQPVLRDTVRLLPVVGEGAPQVKPSSQTLKSK